MSRSRSLSLIAAGAIILALIAAAQVPASAFPFAQATSPATAAVSGGLPGVAIDNLRVHALPTTTSDTLVILNAGDQVTAIGRDQNGVWLQVTTAAGVTGWAASAYIKLTGETLSLPVVQPTPPPAVTAECGLTGGILGRVDTKSLQLRKLPKQTADVLETLQQGDPVTVLGADESGAWLNVQAADGQIGWASAFFIYLTAGQLVQVPVIPNAIAFGTVTPTPSAAATQSAAAGAPTCVPPTATPQATVKAAVVVNSLNLRSRPSNTSPVLAALKAGDTVTVLGASRSNLWFVVQTQDGLVGWVGAAYIKLTVGKLSDVPYVNDNYAPATEAATPAS